MNIVDKIKLLFCFIRPGSRYIRIHSQAMSSKMFWWSVKTLGKLGYVLIRAFDNGTGDGHIFIWCRWKKIKPVAIGHNNEIEICCGDEDIYSSIIRNNHWFCSNCPFHNECANRI